MFINWNKRLTTTWSTERRPGERGDMGVRPITRIGWWRWMKGICTSINGSKQTIEEANYIISMVISNYLLNYSDISPYRFITMSPQPTPYLVVACLASLPPTTTHAPRHNYWADQPDIRRWWRLCIFIPLNCNFPAWLLPSLSSNWRAIPLSASAARHEGKCWLLLLDWLTPSASMLLVLLCGVMMVQWVYDHLYINFLRNDVKIDAKIEICSN